MSLKVADLRWPPRSPYEALMSSPNGRKKFQEMQERRLAASASAKNFTTSPYVRTKANQLLEDGNENGTEEDDEDEETLQLKLAAIEARLKLKKLQQSKSKSRPPSFDEETNNDTPISPSRPPSRFLMERKRKAANMSQQESIQVPVSPSKRLAASADPVSPRRIVLGIDKGKKGNEVSLRRPPSSRSTGRPSSSIGGYRDELLLRRPHSSTSRSAGLAPDEGRQRPKSFSERIAESRSIDKDRRQKTQLLHRKRTTAFAVDKDEMERFHFAAKEESGKVSNFDSPGKTQRVEEFSRDDVIQSYNLSGSGLRKSKSISSIHGSGPATQWTPEKGGTHQSLEFQQHGEAHTTPYLPNNASMEDDSQNSKPTKASDPSKFEPFSGLHLSNRILPHSFLTRTLETKSPMRIPDLLKTIKGPEFDPPDVDGDYVVFGIIASKSTPKEHQDPKKGASSKKDPDDDGSNNNSKYMVLTLTDLKWSIDLFLFSTAFPRYYKLIPGTVVAILNPSIMPPPPNKLDTNRFSLTLNSSDDTILEIGKAQDLGFCKATRKDGKVCEAWVDGRKTEFCEFHVDLQLRKTTAKRMEVNSGPGIFGPGGRSGSRTGMLNRNRGNKDFRFKPEGAQTDRSTGSTYYVAPPVPGSRSAASLIDADDPFIAAANDFQRGNGKLDRLQKRLAEHERERNITKFLGESNSVGAQYLRHRRANDTPGRDGSAVGAPSSSNALTSGASNNNEKEDGSASQSARATLGLSSKTKSAGHVKLGPMKKGAVNKKTRFVTAKGIRDAGRDSLSGPGGGTVNDNNADYDDDLDIV
ncbi:minichromosome maintenance protein 10 [Blastomyces parvus]|uniref:Minichromosome maintenance protein 10 n=1 Tax=Blastomyces parvus TaxID=2060905 RepID=A0A2B7XPL1_9EURO|nr:minichromosome maintenance protein 10 [Blastomyces parvus]